MDKRVLILPSAVLVSIIVYFGCDGSDSSPGGSGSFDAGNGSGFDSSSPPSDAGIDSAQSPTTDAGDDGAAAALAGCADGTREGLSLATYPKVAACGGTWTGNVSNAAPICAAGWHLCDGSEPALTAVQYTDAIAAVGCFAINAAQDNNTCVHGCTQAIEAGVDSADNIDMGAIGSTCPYQIGGTSCITGGRIDFSENSGTGCNFATGLTGAVCCQN